MRMKDDNDSGWEIAASYRCWTRVLSFGPWHAAGNSRPMPLSCEASPAQLLVHATFTHICDNMYLHSVNSHGKHLAAIHECSYRDIASELPLNRAQSLPDLRQG